MTPFRVRRSSSMKVARLGRPPSRLSRQPQGSTSPETLDEKTGRWTGWGQRQEFAPREIMERLKLAALPEEISASAPPLLTIKPSRKYPKTLKWRRIQPAASRPRRSFHQKMVSKASSTEPTPVSSMPSNSRFILERLLMGRRHRLKPSLEASFRRTSA